MNKTKVYIYSDTNDYITHEYTSLMEDNMGILMKGSTSSLSEFIAGSSTLAQLDTETNVTDQYTERKLYVLQLGTIDKSEQHIFDIPNIATGSDIDTLLRTYLASETSFLAHGAKFEYTVVFKHYGIAIKNFKDTMLGSRLITAGLALEAGYHSLSNLLEKTFGIDMSKEEQTTFTEEQMTPAQLVYARHDVIYLYALYKSIMRPLTRHGLKTVFHLENKAIRPIGDLTINGMFVHTPSLDENIASYKAAVAKYKGNLITSILEEKKSSVVEAIAELNIFQKQDEVVINWRSSKQRLAIFKHFYPGESMVSTAKVALIKLEKAVDDPGIVTQYLNGDTDSIEMLLVSRHMAFLKANEMFIAKGALNLNMNSDKQMLALFKIWYPNLTSIGEKVLKKIKHPVIVAYKSLAKKQKLLSTYGEKMYSYIEADGRIHAEFNQLVPTGSRMSSKKPNQQNAPATSEFRRIYRPRPGFLMVDTDYSSCEMILSAYMSKDRNLLKAIRNGYDIHGYSAYLIFEDAWIAAGGSKTPMGKPATAAANALRKVTKGLSFSLLYGTGVVNFSENAGVTVSEGKRLMAKYYSTFPELASFFKASGEEALTYNKVVEPYFKRIRFFNRPTNGMEVSHNKNAGMNYKPQAANTSILKYAVCIIKKYIEDNKLGEKVFIINMIHDEVITEVREDFADKWAVIQTTLMEKAALVAIPEGTLKAESDILKHWTKG